MQTIVEPFVCSPSTLKLLESYPDPSVLKEVYSQSNYEERLGIIRLWITEGIPFAFKKHPLLYEEVRSFVAEGISVQPKEITLVGSGRIGYSLSKKEWGRPFNSGSDFDFVIVSNNLFGIIVSEFQKWVEDLGAKRIMPKDASGMQTWLENIKHLDKKIPVGFIQIRLIPYHANYRFVKKCYDTIWLLRKKLEFTSTAPQISGASIRVYSSWKACVEQLRINFNSALSLWSKP